MTDKEILTFQECCDVLNVDELNLICFMRRKKQPLPFSQLYDAIKPDGVRFLRSSVIEWLRSLEVQGEDA